MATRKAAAPQRHRFIGPGLLALAASVAIPASAQNVVGALNELAPFCLGRLCLGMSIEEARSALANLQVSEKLAPEQLCTAGRYRDVTAVANPKNEASVAAQFRRYASAGGLEVQYRLWSISLTESMDGAAAQRRMTPHDLERLRDGLSQRYHLRPTRDAEQRLTPGGSVQGDLLLRALPQWQVGVTTQYNARVGSSIVLYALAEGDMASWEQIQPGCGKSPEGLLAPGQRPPAQPAQPAQPARPAPRQPEPPPEWRRNWGT
jgi:hypothetical protein